MDRQDIVKRLLYPKCKTAIEFKFDSLLVNPLLTYISIEDIAQLNKIATSIKYSSKPKQKYAMIESIMTNRGFRKMASGTNRVVYRCLNDYRVVIKIAIDKVGLSDNGNEFRNQHLLKPFVTKCFEVSPCGTVGLFERVVPITSREEFINISDDVFDLINNLIGKYVIEDIGEKYYMNYGLREGFGPVLLDYPYVFELDGRKLFCNVPDQMEPKGYCGGEIDYDLGYNDLRCKKCGKRYLATDLKTDQKSDKQKIIIKGEDDTMIKCVLKRGDEIVSTLNSEKPVSTNVIKSKSDFAKLKVHLKETIVQEDKNEVIYPDIKTHDDVNLKVRLRNIQKATDYDALAREEAESKVEKITVPVADEPVEAPVKEEPVSAHIVEVSEAVAYVEPNKAGEEALPVRAVEISETESHEEVPESVNTTEEETDTEESDKMFNTYEVAICDGSIINIDTHDIIGYTVEQFDKKVEEFIEKIKKLEKRIDNLCESAFEPDCNVENSTESEPEEEYVEYTYESDSEPANEEEYEYVYSEEEYTEEATEYSDPDQGNTIGSLCGSQLAVFAATNNSNYSKADVVSKVDGMYSSAPVSKKNNVTNEEIRRENK